MPAIIEVRDAVKRFGGLLRTFRIPHELARMSALENPTVVPADQSGEHLDAAWSLTQPVALVRRRTGREDFRPRAGRLHSRTGGRAP